MLQHNIYVDETDHVRNILITEMECGLTNYRDYTC